MDKIRRTAIIMHIFFLTAVVIYAILITIVIPSLGIQIWPPDDPNLVIIEAVLAVVTVISLLIAYYMPSWLLKMSGTGISGTGIQGQLSLYIIRVSWIEAIGVFGLILGIVGAEMLISLIFVIIAAVALIFTFPTEAKWNKLAERYNKIYTPVEDSPDGILK